MPNSDHLSADPRVIFELFNEIGIIGQLSRTLFEARMEDGMTLPQFSVLNHLSRLGDGKTPLSLARAFQVPKTTMSHTLASLEKAHRIEVCPNPEDGRGKLVYLTETGKIARESAIAALGPDILRLMPTFSTEDALEILPALRKLRQELDNTRDPV